MTPQKILVVDDEADIVEILAYNLEKENYTVLKAENGKKALQIAKAEKPQMILLDVMMPEMDGIQACIEMRKIKSLENTLIVFLSARSEEFTQLAAFDAGANDFVTKPVKPKILLQKINALFNLRKPDPVDAQTINLPGLRIDKNQYLVFLNEDEYSLPRKEFELLSFLATEPNRVFNRDEILYNVWGEDVVVGDRTIDVHIRKLREKLPIKNIKTVKGVGYKYQTD